MKKCFFAVLVLMILPPTLDSQSLGVAGNAREILSPACEVGIVFRPQIVDPQHGLVLAHLRDADPAYGLPGGSWD